MSNSRFLLALMSVAILLATVSDALAKEGETGKYETSHIRTVEQKQGGNYYSYNFAVNPMEDTIDRIKVAVTSDLETRYVETEKDIIPPHFISFGTMIHAVDPDKIKHEVVEIITK